MEVDNLESAGKEKRPVEAEEEEEEDPVGGGELDALKR